MVSEPEGGAGQSGTLPHGRGCRAGRGLDAGVLPQLWASGPRLVPGGLRAESGPGSKPTPCQCPARRRLSPGHMLVKQQGQDGTRPLALEGFALAFTLKCFLARGAGGAEGCPQKWRNYAFCASGGRITANAVFHKLKMRVLYQGLMGGELPVTKGFKQKLEVPERKFLQKVGPTPKHQDKVQRWALTPPPPPRPPAPLCCCWYPQSPLVAKRLRPGGPAGGPGQVTSPSPSCRCEHSPSEPLLQEEEAQRG